MTPGQIVKFVLEPEIVGIVTEVSTTAVRVVYFCEGARIDEWVSPLEITCKSI